MKSVLMLLIICSLAAGIFLIGTGCEDPPPPPPPPPPSSPPPPPPPPPSDPYDGFMTAEESEKWLRNNHYQVQKNADGDGYIIICNYYDPGPPSIHYNTRMEISDRSMASISGPTSALATIDVKGQLRVAPSGTQQ